MIFLFRAPHESTALAVWRCSRRARTRGDAVARPPTRRSSACSARHHRERRSNTCYVEGSGTSRSVADRLTRLCRRQQSRFGHQVDSETKTPLACQRSTPTLALLPMPSEHRLKDTDSRFMRPRGTRRAVTRASVDWLIMPLTSTLIGCRRTYSKLCSTLSRGGQWLVRAVARRLTIRAGA
jgi:hypothetical protein